MILCAWTCPHGFETKYYADLLAAEGFKKDEDDNWYLSIGESSTAFMAHLDTVGTIPEPVTICVSAEGNVSTLGKTVLGADDRAGLTVILWMIRNKVPGRYCLFVGEEQGCIGSRAALEDTDSWSDVLRAVSFDRKGTGSVITHQCGVRTASDEFALALCAEARDLGLNWSPDPDGVFTDSEVFAELIPECTNISVGYQGQHTSKETQDLGYLERLCEACCLIDWESLPAERDPSVTEREWRSSDDWYSDWPKEKKRGNDKWYGHGGTGFDAWDRVEMALELGQAPDGDDLAEIVLEDADFAARLIGAYLKGG